MPAQAEWESAVALVPPHVAGALPKGIQGYHVPELLLVIVVNPVQELKRLDSAGSAACNGDMS